MCRIGWGSFAAAWYHLHVVHSEFLNSEAADLPTSVLLQGYNEVKGKRFTQFKQTL